MSINDPNKYPYTDTSKYPYADPPSGVSSWVLGGFVGLCIAIVVGLITWDGLNDNLGAPSFAVPIHTETTGAGSGAAPISLAVPSSGKLAPVAPAAGR